MDGVLSADGYLDSYDVVSWDWVMNSGDRLLNLCGVPLFSTVDVTAKSTNYQGFADFPTLVDIPSNISDLLILGKRGGYDAPSKLKDRLYAFDSNGLCVSWSDAESQRCNIRLVQDQQGELYVLNSETGLCRLDNTSEKIITPGKVEILGTYEPRYNKPATVYVGIQGKGSDSYGRPILDAAFDANYVYVVPVVVNPEGSEPYTAAAKLRILSTVNPPYQVVQLYDQPPLPNDNQYRDALREIEVDSAGNVYVINAHSLNESDILFKYRPDGVIERFDIGRPDSVIHVPAPIAMYISETSGLLYLASSQYNPTDINSTIVYGFSTDASLSLQRFIIINGMQHVSSITEDRQTGTLWIIGFNMESVPLYPNPFQPPFYYPYLAEISRDNNVRLISLLDPVSHDLAFPMSIVWTAKNE
jgi:hypothetical protein